MRWSDDDYMTNSKVQSRWISAPRCTAAVVRVVSPEKLPQADAVGESAVQVAALELDVAKG